MKKYILVCFLILLFSVFACPQTAKVEAKELGNLSGAQWKGTLTYLDYQKNTKVSIPANLTVTPAKGAKSSWVFAYQYPDEPKADSTETVVLSADGTIFDGETIVEKIRLADKTLKMVTQKSGSDNNKKALFRFTYLLGKKTFSLKKEVRYEETADFFVRNEYSWKR